MPNAASIAPGSTRTSNGESNPAREIGSTPNGDEAPSTNLRKRLSMKFRGSPKSSAPPDPYSMSDLDTSGSSSDEEDEGAEDPKHRKVDGQENEEHVTAQKPPSRECTQGEGLDAHYPRKFQSDWIPRSRFSISNAHASAKGKVSKRDGRLKISLHEHSSDGYLAKILGKGMKRHLGAQAKAHSREHSRVFTFDEAKANRSVTEAMLRTERMKRPRMNIVIMVIGSRGDIQPFVKIGKILQDEYGHRVRIATHPAFREFVEEDNGLELFSVGGDPSELMAFMVKNPGLIPSLETVKKGEIGKRRTQMYEMFEGFWRSCIEPRDGHERENETDGGEKEKAFIADAIIANPPSFAHVHCAERLGCPLHIMFTFPYSPTQQFPHPLANIKKVNVDPSYVNFMSYPIVEMMTWQGLGDLVNRFRIGTLGLDPVSTVWAPGQLYRLKVPYTYMWSPSLVPKPEDWGPEIDIAGFVFLELASNYKAPEDLLEFLDAGEPPIYIGFGSIVVDDPSDFTNMIFKAVKEAGVRAVINEGWGGFGDKDHTPENIFMINNVPHDWLFPRCKAVVHHGGAGTTAIGLKLARPTLIVPFFGDQPFWGAMVAAAKAGAHECIPYKDLTAEKLAEGIKQCLSEEAQENVQKIADSIAEEGDGARNAVESFQAQLPWKGYCSMRCSFLEDRVAAWQLKGSQLRLSALAAELLVQDKKLGFNELKLLRHYEWNDFQGPGGPLTGLAGGMIRSVTGFGKGIGEGPLLMSRDIHKHAHYERRKIQKQMRKKKKETQRAKEEKEAQGAVEEESGQEPADEDLQKSDSSPRQSTQKAGKPLKDRHRHVTDSESRNGMADNEKTNDEHDERDGVETQRVETRQSVITTESHTPQHNVGSDVVRDVWHGTKRSAGALAKAPMELLLGFGQGLHNAPRLYHDETVRRPRRIQGLHSGLVAAREALLSESYDGVTGIVLQPWQGAKESGAKGFAAGVGKGLTGFVLKEGAAIVNPIAFTMKGIHREAVKHRTPLRQMRATRMQEGHEEALALGVGEREQALQRVIDGWAVMRELRRTKRKIRSEGWAGIKGHFKWEREKSDWQRYGALESVQVAQKVLDARKKGIPFERFMVAEDADADSRAAAVAA